MSHEWNDFSEETPPLGPELPLSTGQMYPGVQIPSGVLPSGEANFLDPIQYQNDENLPNPANVGGSGINWPFPYPNLKTKEEYAFTSGIKKDDFPEQFSDEWWDNSGILKTYPEDTGGLEDDRYDKSPRAIKDKKVGSGIFTWDGNKAGTQNPGQRPTDVLNGSLFSNGEDVRTAQIDDFTIFNTYKHHHRFPQGAVFGESIEIPFLSTYKISIDFNAYGGTLGFDSRFKN